MDVGLLWHDNGAEDLAIKLSRAAARYRARFGQPPNVCYVHPTALPNGDKKIGAIQVRSSPKILRHHLWLGYETGSTSAVS
ncbi:MAG TPA: hypothetical protein PKH77_00175 [Anaerolineae bacterium]|nr:hypothetical protein [Anaerolineae bacterium]